MMSRWQNDILFISLYFSVFFKTIRKTNFVIKLNFSFDVVKGSTHLKHVAPKILVQKYIYAGDFSSESTYSHQCPHPARLRGKRSLRYSWSSPSQQCPAKALNIVRTTQHVKASPFIDPHWLFLNWPTSRETWVLEGQQISLFTEFLNLFCFLS